MCSFGTQCSYSGFFHCKNALQSLGHWQTMPTTILGLMVLLFKIWPMPLFRFDTMTTDKQLKIHTRISTQICSSFLFNSFTSPSSLHSSKLLSEFYYNRIVCSSWNFNLAKSKFTAYVCYFGYAFKLYSPNSFNIFAGFDYIENRFSCSDE